MQRVTITIDDELDAELDRFMQARGYVNRSEATCDLARSGLQQAAVEVGGSWPCAWPWPAPRPWLCMPSAGR